MDRRAGSHSFKCKRWAWSEVVSVRVISDVCHSWQQCSRNLCSTTSMQWFPWCLLLYLLPAHHWNPCPCPWCCTAWAPHHPRRRTQLRHRPSLTSCATGNSQPLRHRSCCFVLPMPEMWCPEWWKFNQQINSNHHFLISTLMLFTLLTRSEIIKVMNILCNECAFKSLIVISHVVL